MEGHTYDNLSYHNMTTSLCDSSTDPMTSLLEPPPVKPWEILLTMREELINHMRVDYIIGEEEDSHLNDISNVLIQFMKDFNEQRDKMDHVEKSLKECITKTQQNIQVLTSFIEFLSMISEQMDKDISPLLTQIVEISKDISNECTVQGLKETYTQEKIKYHQHLNVIRLMNQMNIGSTCSICFQDNVDSYFNPCGHTACAKCCSTNASYGNPCPLCRKDIRSVHKLYFT